MIKENLALNCHLNRAKKKGACREVSGEKKEQGVANEGYILEE